MNPVRIMLIDLPAWTQDLPGHTMLSVEDLAKHLKCSTEAVRCMASDKRLPPAVRRPNIKHNAYLWSLEALRKFLRGEVVASEAPERKKGRPLFF